MALGDLTTLENVKAFLPGATPVDNDDDDLLRRLIRAFSAKFRNEADRAAIYRGSFTYKTVSPTGYTRIRAFDQWPPLIGITPAALILGATRCLLYEYPVTSVTSVKIDNQTIPARPAYDPGAPNATREGWELRSDGIDLYGYTFTPGAPVEIVYTAGFEALAEPHTIPASSPYTVQADQFFIGDIGVTQSNGSALSGSYTASSSGLYTFTAADAGKAILLSYGTVPAEIEQAVIGRVVLAYNERPNVGVASSSMTGQSVTFNPNVAGVLSAWKDALEHYSRPVTG